MHILICDDDAAFAAQMDEYISEWFRAREIQVQSTVCTSGEQLLATPELGHYQLAFLDVDLKTTDGIALGRQLRQVAPDIVLVYISAYLEFAPQGYTVNAYRYLLKRDIAAQLPSCLEDIFAGMTDPKKTLEVRHNRTTSEIPLDQIYYLESDLRQINVYGDIPHHPQRARPRHGAFQRAGRSAAPWCGVYPELPGQLVPLYLCGAHRQFMTSAPSEYDSFCATQA